MAAKQATDEVSDRNARYSAALHYWIEQEDTPMPGEVEPLARAEPRDMAGGWWLGPVIVGGALMWGCVLWLVIG